MFVGHIFKIHICKYLIQFQWYLNVSYLPSDFNFIWLCRFSQKIICFKAVMKIPKKCHKKIEKSSRLHEKTSLSGPWQRIQGVLEWFISTFIWQRSRDFAKTKWKQKNFQIFFDTFVFSFHQNVSNSFVFLHFPLKYVFTFEFQTLYYVCEISNDIYNFWDRHICI